jgi:hypothetical protein
VTAEPRQRRADAIPLSRTLPTAREAHRATVVRRLLDRGVRPTTLEVFLPGWVELIARVVEGSSPEGATTLDLPAERTPVEEPA